MRAAAGVILACTFAVSGGCAADHAAVRRGTPITHVQAEYGLPDVIADRSGDQARFYVPARRPQAEWPADAPRTFYYLERDLAVTFVSGKAVRPSRPIDRQLRDQALLPLLRQHSVTDDQREEPAAVTR